MEDAGPSEVGEEGGRPAVAVDWYGTLYVRDHVPQSNLSALWELHDEGLDVHLLSFCGYKRRRRQRSWTSPSRPSPL